MPNIRIIKPEEIVEKSKSRFFQIYLVTEVDTFTWNAKSFHDVKKNLQGFENINLHSKDDVVQQYYEAAKAARQLPEGFDGTLQVVEIPLFGSEPQ